MTEQNKAGTNYTAIGRYQVILDTFFVDTSRTIRIDTVTRAVSQNDGNGNGDPLAQTFSFLVDSIVPQIGVFFGTKDPVLPVTMQLRDVSNGYPGPTVYGSCTLQPSQVSVSNNASLETVFVFKDPILCNRDTQYCWVLMTDSAQYRVWVAKMGEKDIASNAYVSAQPFLGGTLFSSNDNSAWTAHQEMDAKFKIYIAKFDSANAILNFDQITGIEATQIILAVTQIIQSGTAIQWEVSENNVDWLPIEVNNGVNQLSSKYVDCYLRAILIGTTNSPLINTGAIVATGIKFELTGEYINRNIVTLSPFTTINLWADTNLPSGTTAIFKYSVDDGITWNDCTLNSTTVLSSSVNQKYYKNTVAPSSQLRIKIDLTGTELTYAQIGRLMVTMV